MVSVVTINRPDIRNAISDAEVLEPLLEILDAVDVDEGSRALVLTGAGTSFCSGGNIKTIQSDLAADIGVAGTQRFYRNGIQRLAERFEMMRTPSVAAVNGPALGLGCDLACMCDVRIGSPESSFAMTFVKLGLIPGDGGVALLPRIVGFARATEMILTGAAINAEQALACGLVSRIVPAGDLLAEAISIANKIAENPPHATSLARRLLRRESGRTLTDTLELSAAFQAIAHSTDDHREAISALRERRSPTYSGR